MREDIFINKERKTALNIRWLTD